jgi:MFS family permease
MKSFLSRAPAPATAVDTRESWVVTVAAVVCLGLAFGGPLVTTVALKAIAQDMGDARTVPALGASLSWLGAAVGGVFMSRVADRIGVRWTVMAGGVSILIGLSISTLGQPWQLYLGHGLFVGFLGIAGLNAPLYVYISHWFERRRGSALALLSSGNYIAGIGLPVLFETTIDRWGWRATMAGYGVVQAVVTVALAVWFLRPPPAVAAPAAGGRKAAGDGRVFGMNPNAVFAMLAVASFLCCVPMAMPQGHLVALCTDHGLSAAVGATMLSTLLGVAFLSRQAWGLVADRYGGLRTALISSVMQAAAVTGYLYAHEQFGLFAVSIAFSLGFTALIPAYILTIREVFPAAEAYWRVPVLLLLAGSGMAVGGWLAGFLYDLSGSYDSAFFSGVLSNLLNLALLAVLVRAQIKTRRLAAAL